MAEPRKKKWDTMLDEEGGDDLIKEIDPIPKQGDNVKILKNGPIKKRMFYDPVAVNRGKQMAADRMAETEEGLKNARIAENDLTATPEARKEAEGQKKALIARRDTEKGRIKPIGTNDAYSQGNNTFESVIGNPINQMQREAKDTYNAELAAGGHSDEPTNPRDLLSDREKKFVDMYVKKYGFTEEEAKRYYDAQFGKRDDESRKTVDEMKKLSKDKRNKQYLDYYAKALAESRGQDLSVDHLEEARLRMEQDPEEFIKAVKKDMEAKGVPLPDANGDYDMLTKEGYLAYMADEFPELSVKDMDELANEFYPDEKVNTKEFGPWAETPEKAAQAKVKQKKELEKQKELERQKRIAEIEAWAPSIKRAAGLLGLNLLSKAPEIGATHLEATKRLFNAFLTPSPISQASKVMVAVASSVGEGAKIIESVNRAYGITDPKNEYAKNILLATAKGRQRDAEIKVLNNYVNDLANGINDILEGKKVEDITAEEFDGEMDRKLYNLIVPELNRLRELKKRADTNPSYKMSRTDMGKLNLLENVNMVYINKGKEFRRSRQYITGEKSDKLIDNLGNTFGISMAKDPSTMSPQELDTYLKGIGEKFTNFKNKYGAEYEELKKKKAAGVVMSVDEEVKLNAYGYWMTAATRYQQNPKEYLKRYKEEEDRRIGIEAKKEVSRIWDHHFEPRLDQLTSGNKNAYRIEDEFMSVMRTLFPDLESRLTKLKELSNPTHADLVEMKKLGLIKDRFNSAIKEIRRKQGEDGVVISNAMISHVCDGVTDKNGMPINLIDLDEKTAKNELSSETLDDLRNNFMNESYIGEFSLHDIYMHIAKIGRSSRSKEQKMMFDNISAIMRMMNQAGVDLRRVESKNRVVAINTFFNDFFDPTMGVMEMVSNGQGGEIMLRKEGTPAINVGWQQALIAKIVQRADTDKPTAESVSVVHINNEYDPEAVYTICPTDSEQRTRYSRGLASYYHELEEVLKYIKDENMKRRISNDMEHIAKMCTQVREFSRANTAVYSYSLDEGADSYKVLIKKDAKHDPQGNIGGIYGVSVCGTNIPRMLQYKTKHEKYEEEGKRLHGRVVEKGYWHKKAIGDDFNIYNMRVVDQFRIGQRLLRGLPWDSEFISNEDYSKLHRYVTACTLISKDSATDYAYLKGEMGTVEECANTPELREARTRLFNFIEELRDKKRAYYEAEKEKAKSKGDHKRVKEIEKAQKDEERRTSNGGLDPQKVGFEDRDFVKKERENAGVLGNDKDFKSEMPSEEEIRTSMLSSNVKADMTSDNFITFFNNAKNLKGIVNGADMAEVWTFLGYDSRKELLGLMEQAGLPSRYQGANKKFKGGMNRICELIDMGVKNANAHHKMKRDGRELDVDLSKKYKSAVAAMRVSAENHYGKNIFAANSQDDVKIREVQGNIWNYIRPSFASNTGKNGYRVDDMGMIKGGVRIDFPDENLDLNLRRGVVPETTFAFYHRDELRQKITDGLGYPEQNSTNRYIQSVLSSGEMHMHKKFNLSNKALKECVNLAKEFGLNPKEYEIYDFNDDDNYTNLCAKGIEFDKKFNSLSEFVNNIPVTDENRDKVEALKNAVGGLGESLYTGNGDYGGDNVLSHPDNLGFVSGAFVMKNYSNIQRYAFDTTWREGVSRREKEERTKNIIGRVKDITSVESSEDGMIEYFKERLGKGTLDGMTMLSMFNDILSIREAMEDDAISSNFNMVEYNMFDDRIRTLRSSKAIVGAIVNGFNMTWYNDLIDTDMVNMNLNTTIKKFKSLSEDTIMEEIDETMQSGGYDRSDLRGLIGKFRNVQTILKCVHPKDYRNLKEKMDNVCDMLEDKVRTMEESDSETVSKIMMDQMRDGTMDGFDANCRVLASKSVNIAKYISSDSPYIVRMQNGRYGVPDEVLMQFFWDIMTENGITDDMDMSESFDLAIPIINTIRKNPRLYNTLVREFTDDDGKKDTFIGVTVDGYLELKYGDAEKVAAIIGKGTENMSNNKRIISRINKNIKVMANEITQTIYGDEKKDINTALYNKTVDIVSKKLMDMYNSAEST